jgi:hypothetical protein
VPDVPLTAVRTAQQVAVDDDPGADAGRDLDEQQRRGGGPLGVVLAEGHGVRVVVDHAADGELLLEVIAEREVMPARHDRGVVDDPAGGDVDRPGHADAQAEDAARRHRGGVQHLPPAQPHPLEDRLRTVGDPQVVDGLGERAAGEVADRERRVRGAEVGSQHHPAGPVEGEHVRRAAAPGGRPPGLAEVSGLDEGIDPGGDGGAGQSGELDQLAARARPTPADQVEQVPRALPQVLTPSRPRRSGHR